MDTKEKKVAVNDANFPISGGDDEVKPGRMPFTSKDSHVSSPKSSATNDSQLMYADQDQTIILFDWDDTLCPSTFAR